VPKNQAIRQRRNRSASRAILPAEAQPIESTPRLPDNPMGDWHKLTRRWWKDIWSSPQHSEFLRADLGALFRLAILVNKFWLTGSLPVAREIRLMEHEFGLTPLSRRRLEWSVAQAEEAASRHEDKRSRRAKIVDDPRGVLG
jgi:hypothetical protein